MSAQSTSPARGAPPASTSATAAAQTARVEILFTTAVARELVAVLSKRMAELQVPWPEPVTGTTEEGMGGRRQCLNLLLKLSADARV